MQTLIALTIIYALVGELIIDKMKKNSKVYGLEKDYSMATRLYWPYLVYKANRLMAVNKALTPLLLTRFKGENLTGTDTWETMFIVNPEGVYGTLIKQRGEHLFSFDVEQPKLIRYSYGSNGSVVPNYYTIDGETVDKKTWLRAVESTGKTGMLISELVHSFDGYRVIPKVFKA